MNFNSFVFPAPKASYSSEILGNELIWIPNYKHAAKKKTDNNKPNNKKTNSNRMKNEDHRYKLSDQLSEEINIENPLPNYMTPQASIAKKFDFNSYNKKYCSNETNYHNSSKSKINGNNATIFEASYSNENYDEKEDDFRPKNLEKYCTRTLDNMNVFTKYSSNNYESIGSTRANQKKLQAFDHSLKQISYIPSLLLEFPSNPNPEYIVLFFHGNGEDIYLAYELIDSIRITLKVFFT